jgi:hypothetical protein
MRKLSVRILRVNLLGVVDALPGNIFTVCIPLYTAGAARPLLVTPGFGTGALMAGFLPRRHFRLLKALFCVPRV